MDKRENIYENIYEYNPGVIKALQALHHAPPLHLHQASAITLSKIKFVLHVISL